MRSVPVMNLSKVTARLVVFMSFRTFRRHRLIRRSFRQEQFRQERLRILYPGNQHQFVYLYFMNFGHLRPRSTCRHVDPFKLPMASALLTFFYTGTTQDILSRNSAPSRRSLLMVNSIYYFRLSYYVEGLEDFFPPNLSKESTLLMFF